MDCYFALDISQVSNPHSQSPIRNPSIHNPPSAIRNQIAVQKVLASGTGHHRSWTRPMMYFFGTNPQWRLSELLFR